MKYFSTRAHDLSFNLEEAILQGLAPDGGLFLPEHIETIDLASFSKSDSFVEVSKKLYGSIAPELCGLVEEAFNFPVELKELNATTKLLELFHGPTAAFKDFGARILAGSLQRIAQRKKIKPTVLVATSGDTGGAVASAFEHISHVKVVILFPKKGVSPRQEIQLGCWGDGVKAVRVNGSFDDCQALVKKAFANEGLRKKHLLTSANSINIARLLGQVSYYAWTSLQEAHANYIIPTGNLGNAFACIWAKKMGFPIQKIRLATNANSTLVDYFNKGNYKPQTSISTLANAMDVGAPSNFERLVHWLPDLGALHNFGIDVRSVQDHEIRETIQNTTYAICPHTACALSSVFSDSKNIVVSTAHPAKFETIVEPLIGRTLALPRSISNLKNRATSYYDIENHFEDFVALLE